MSLPLQIAIAAAALLPLTALAQKPETRDPTHADATVPAVVYRSAFSGYQPLHDDTASPDSNWLAANRQAGDLGGHVGHVGQVGMADRPASSLPARAGGEAPPHRHDKHHHH